MRLSFNHQSHITSIRMNEEEVKSLLLFLRIANQSMRFHNELSTLCNGSPDPMQPACQSFLLDLLNFHCSHYDHPDSIRERLTDMFQRHDY